ncbi:MAG: chemotaxis protein CheW [Pseudomonadota bacterium]
MYANRLHGDYLTDCCQVFYLGPQAFAIDVDKIEAVLPVPEIAEIPIAPGYVAGIINLGGSAVTLFDTRKMMSLGTPPLTSESRVLLVEWHKITLGLLVDRVGIVANVMNHYLTRVFPCEEDRRFRYVCGLYQIGSETVQMLAAEKLIAEGDRNAIQAV